jgi:hypothetical protein
MVELVHEMQRNNTLFLSDEQNKDQAKVSLV